jgi:AcrR family transcriptional regulator
MGRTSREDWLDVGLRILRDSGERALTIERLCESLGRTKGSFYHHFGGLDGFVEQLLQRWEEELTRRPILLAREEQDIAKRARRLGEVVRKLDHRLDLSVRAWGLREPRVQAFVSRVDRLRIQCLAELHAAQGRRNSEVLAEFEYAAFIGAQQLGLLEGPHAAAIQKVLRRGLEQEGK